MIGVDSFQESLNGHIWPSRDGKDDGYETSGVRFGEMRVAMCI